MQFPDFIIQEIKDHAELCAPMEACGLIAGGQFIPCENVHEDPEMAFRIAPEIYLDVVSRYGRIDALVHSHIDGPDHPTPSDMVGQMDMAVPWGIVVVRDGVPGNPFWFGDQLSIAPLVGRSFRWGVYDCYGLVRDWYRIHRGIVLPNFPREWAFWEKGQNTIEDNILAAGFERIPMADRPGDVVGMRILGPVTNHVAVHLGGGLIGHHQIDRLSRMDDSLGKWRNRVTFYARLKGEEL